MRNYVFAAVAVASLAVSAVAFAPNNMGNNFARNTNLKMSAEAEFVNTEIAANDVVVFSKSFCPFCKKTKAALDGLKIEYKAYELNQMDNGADIQAALLEISGQRTVPNVYAKGTHIGGNDDTQAAIKSGQLSELLG